MDDMTNMTCRCVFICVCVCVYEWYTYTNYLIRSHAVYVVL